MILEKYTVEQDGKHLMSTKITEQAVTGAKRIAEKTGRDVSVIAHHIDGKNWENIYHPDGSVVKTWKK